VEYFGNGSLIAASSTAPHDVSWKPDVGDYAVQAKAIAEDGSETWTPPLRVSVASSSVLDLSLLAVPSLHTLQIEARGQPPQQFALERSADLKNWQRVGTYSLQNTNLTIPVISSEGQLREFFRAVTPP
jgi:uncharacterized membrane protein